MSRAPNASVPSLWSRVGSWWRRLGQSAAVAVGMALAALATHAASANTCPADFDGNEQVDGADLGTMLAGWGQPGITDLDDNGTTDGADLGALLAAWGACPKPSPTVFTGVVVLSDGTPVSDAVVVTNLGGTATTGKGGDYELSLMLDSPPASVTLTAVASIGGTTYQGSAVVGKVALGELNEVDPIVVAAKGEGCSGGFGWLPGFGDPGMDATVSALTVFNNELYAAGRFTTAGGVAANCIAKWDGSEWSPLGSGISGGVFPRVNALTVYDTFGPPLLIVGGAFTNAGGVAVNNIAAWNGFGWTDVDGGVSGGPFGTEVYALAVFDNGVGLPRLIVGGEFTNAGGVAVNRIAAWNGFEWSFIGGVRDELPVNALTVFDDGTGPDLYVGGFCLFDTSSGFRRGIARWNGSSWHPVGGEVSECEDPSAPCFPGVYALTVFDDGTGPALYAGGAFLRAGGVEVNNIARWNGSSWSSLGLGFPGDPEDAVYALTGFDDGTGPALYVGGNLYSWNDIARWNGTAWSHLGGMNNGVSALTVFDDGTGPSLYAGGSFTNAGGVQANRIAKSCSP